MKCTQRLCQRTKNLKESGYCNVCDDLFEEMVKKYKALKKPRSFEQVNLDFKLLKETNDNLMSGKVVEPEVVSTLLLGGITNILCQSELVDDAMERIKELEVENLTNKTRLELLESWILKLADEETKLKVKIKQLEDTGKSSHLEPKIDALVKEVNDLKDKSLTPAVCLKSKSCSECNETFSKNFELENHMVKVHGCEQPHSCDICGKKFYLKWRLKKHGSVHSGNVKPCKYLEDGKACPYDEVGCKYNHEEKTEENSTMEGIEDDDDVNDDFCCCYCNKILETQKELIEHMGNDHIDRFSHINTNNNSSS